MIIKYGLKLKRNVVEEDLEEVKNQKHLNKKNQKRIKDLIIQNKYNK